MSGTTMTYDADNEMKAVTYSDGVTPNITSVTYDSDGQRTATADGTGSPAWAYDNLHRLISYTSGNGDTVSYIYNLRIQPAERAHLDHLPQTRWIRDEGI